VSVLHKKFFLWGDETEYYYRIIKKNNIPVCTITNSVHYHPSTRFTIKQDWDYASNWKMYFYVRNRYAVLKAKLNFKPFAILHFACFLTAFAGVIIVFQKTDKIKKLQAMISPAFAAFKNSYEASPATVLDMLENLRNRKPLMLSINKYYQKMSRTSTKFTNVINQNSSAA